MTRPWRIADAVFTVACVVGIFWRPRWALAALGLYFVGVYIRGFIKAHRESKG